jgi:hypothetical protein
MSEVNWLITPQKYHNAALFIDDKYYPHTHGLPGGSIGAGIDCIISIEEKEFVFYQTKLKLSHNFGDIERGDVIFTLAYDLIKQVNISLTRRGTFNWRNPIYQNGKYSLDVEVIRNDNVVYHFEIGVLKILEKFVSNLRDRKIEVVDTINLVEYLKTIEKDDKALYDYIDKNYEDLANKYHLDNPRLKIQVD